MDELEEDAITDDHEIHMLMEVMDMDEVLLEMVMDTSSDEEAPSSWGGGREGKSSKGDVSAQLQ